MIFPITYPQAITVNITWTGLNYTVPVRVGKQLRKRGTKVVLDNVSGHVPPERLLAIMGPTGVWVAGCMWASGWGTHA